MKEVPEINVELNRTDKIVEGIVRLALVGIWVFTLTNYSVLPDTIPIHFDAMGKADGFGNKTTIFILPILLTVLLIGLSMVNKHPNIFNYPLKITADNAQYQYANATRTIRFLKLSIVIVFGLIVFKTIQHTKGNSEGLGSWFLPLTLGLMLIPIIYFLIKSFKRR